MKADSQQSIQNSTCILQHFCDLNLSRIFRKYMVSSISRVVTYTHLLIRFVLYTDRIYWYGPSKWATKRLKNGSQSPICWTSTVDTIHQALFSPGRPKRSVLARGPSCSLTSFFPNLMHNVVMQTVENCQPDMLQSAVS